MARGATKLTRVRSARIAAVACCAAIALTGCRSKPKNFDNDNDALRRQVAELETQLAQMTAERNEFEAQLIELGRVREAGSGDLGADVIAALPRCAGIRIGRYSGLVDRDDLEGPEAIAVYVNTFDGRQRFVQVVGRLTIEVTELPPVDGSDDRPPRVLGEVVLEPADLRDAYRSSPAGTHYTVRIPLPAPQGPVAGTVVIRAELQDLVSGMRFDAQYIPAR